MEALLTGVPENAPTDNAIVTSVSFPQANRMFGAYDTNAITKFALAAGALSVTIPSFTTGTDVFIVVTSSNVGSAKDLDVTGNSSEDLTASVNSTGIYHVGKATMAHATTPVIKVDAMTAQQRIEGYVLLVQEVDA